GSSIVIIAMPTLPRERPRRNESARRLYCLPFAFEAAKARPQAGKQQHRGYHGQHGENEIATISRGRGDTTGKETKQLARQVDQRTQQRILRGGVLAIDQR